MTGVAPARPIVEPRHCPDPTVVSRNLLVAGLWSRRKSRRLRLDRSGM